MTELIGVCTRAYLVHRRDNLKSPGELGSCQKQMARACFARRKLTQLGFAPEGGRKVSECVVFTPPRGANVHHPYCTRFASERGGSVVGVRGGHAPSGSQCPSHLPIPAKAIPTRVNRRRSQQYGDAWAVARSEAPIQQGMLFSTLYPLLGPPLP